jgi:hypothetical protein
MHAIANVAISLTLYHIFLLLVAPLFLVDIYLMPFHK